MSSSSSSKATKKNYTVVECSVGKPGGTYSSSSGPAAAATKAASRRLADAGASKMRIAVQQKSRKKTGVPVHWYEAERIKLENPRVRKNPSGDGDIVIEYETKIKAIKPAVAPAA